MLDVFTGSKKGIVESTIFLKKNRYFIIQERFHKLMYGLFVCAEVLRPSQPNGVMSSAVSLPNHTFTGQA